MDGDRRRDRGGKKKEVVCFLFACAHTEGLNWHPKMCASPLALQCSIMFYKMLRSVKPSCERVTHCKWEEAEKNRHHSRGP